MFFFVYLNIFTHNSVHIPFLHHDGITDSMISDHTHAFLSSNCNPPPMIILWYFISKYWTEKLFLSHSQKSSKIKDFFAQQASGMVWHVRVYHILCYHHHHHRCSACHRKNPKTPKKIIILQVFITCYFLYCA